MLQSRKSKEKRIPDVDIQSAFCFVYPDECLTELRSGFRLQCLKAAEWAKVKYMRTP